MFRHKAVLSVAAISLILAGLAPRVAEAAVGSLHCGGPSGFGLGPVPNVGCKVNWWPGGVYTSISFSGDYFNCTPNCAIIPGYWSISLPISSTPQGSKVVEIGKNCIFNYTIIVTVVGLLMSSGRVGRETVLDVNTKTYTGPVGLFCQSGQVSVSPT